MEDDWDLQAVVRRYTTSSSATTTTATTVFSGETHHNPIFSPVSVGTQHESTDNATFGELRDLYMPFGQESDTSFSVSSYPCLNFSEDARQHRQPQKRLLSSGSVTSRPTSSNNSRSKRRKIQQKRVCHVAAEALSSDVWAWRKYGQKPIKGSPYPRGYYKCSTSKGCLARKQVERNKSDPAMFIVTYTAEHNHPVPTYRTPLAGSSRQKPSSSTVAGDSSSVAATCSSSIPVDEDLLSTSDTVVGDDFFDGLEDFSTVGDSFSGN